MAPQLYCGLNIKGEFKVESVQVIIIKYLVQIFRPILAIIAACCLITSVGYALLDQNGNGLSDVWEQRFNARDLQLAADGDGDGFTNLEECVAGTDPDDSASRPTVDLSVIQNELDQVQVSFPTLLGKRYFLFASNDLQSFESLQPDGWIGDGSIRELFIRSGGNSESVSSVRADFWANVATDSIDDLSGLATFPAQSDGLVYLAAPEAPDFLSTGYGARIISTITAPSSGSYTFFLSAGGPAELYFKASDSPSNAAKIAEILPAQTGLEADVWELYDTQRADAVLLTAGADYQLEMRYVAKAPSQHAQVGWSGPGLVGIEKVEREDLSAASFAAEYELVSPTFLKLTIDEQDQDGDGLGDWEELALAAYYPVLFFDAQSTNGVNDSGVLQGLFETTSGTSISNVSLQATDAAAFESNYPNITEDTGKIKLTRVGSLEPLDVELCFPPLVETGSTVTVCDGSCCMLIGSAGDEEAEPQDFILTDEAGNIVTDVVRFEFGETQKILTLTAVNDSINEYPETVNVAIKVPEDSHYEVSSSINGASIQIFDLPDSPDNVTIFVGAFSQDGNATTATTASGSVIATINGPRTEMRIWSEFSGLTSLQSNSHVHKASAGNQPGSVVYGITETVGDPASSPLHGRLEYYPEVILSDEPVPEGTSRGDGYPWDLTQASLVVSSNSGTAASKQVIIDSLFGQSGETPLYFNVHTADNPAGEIWAFLGLSAGSIDPPDPAEAAPLAGSEAYPALSGYLLEAEVRRFLNQATFGATEDMVDAMVTQIETARSLDPDYHRDTAYENWLDAQMNKSETTQTYLLDYLMATHFQLFWLAGVFDETRNPGYSITNVLIRGQQTETPQAPTTWPSIDRSNADPALWYLNDIYPATFNELQLAAENGLGVDRRFTRLPHYTMTHWQTMLAGGDQLRQKMGYALQQIVVTSNEADDILNNRYGMLNYQDMLNHHAFDYYRDVLGFVNTSPIMGIWLSSLKNQKAIDFDGDGLFDSYPDENLARENMQLFSIGLFDIWADGTLKLTSAGLPRQTYTNDDIKDLARILTGQGIAHDDGSWGGDAPGSAAFLASEENNFNQTLFGGQTTDHTFYPMKMFEAYHSLGSKTVAGVTIDNSDISDLKQQAIADIEDAIDWLAGKPGDGQPDFDMVHSHVSTPAFISLRLIQRFTTSNPSTAYLHRVATVFKESEGHLGLTLKAILLDPVARNLDLSDTVFGMKKSPLEGYLQMLRSLEAHTYIPLVAPVAGEVFDAAPGDYSNPDLYLENFGYPADQINAFSGNTRFFLDSAYTTTGAAGLQMNPFDQETVFNFYVPSYSPGGPIGNAELYAPEMQLVNEADVIRNINFFQDIVSDGSGHVGDELGNTDGNQITAFGGASGAATNDHLKLDLEGLAGQLYPDTEPGPGLTKITIGDATTAAPHWVRLSRVGDVFTSSESADGETWSFLESWVLPLAQQVYVGLAVTSHNDGVLTTAVFDDISLSGTNNVWLSQDIGAVAAAGSVVDNGGGEYAIQASGADIWGADDEFHFMYQTLSGDGEIIAQLKSLVNTHVWTKAGVMMREDLSSDAMHVMTLVSAARGVASESRYSASDRSAESLADEALVDALDHRLTNGLFKLRYPYNSADNGVGDVNKNPREWIIDTLTDSYADPYDGSNDANDRKLKLSDALYLLSTSPEFQVKK